MRSHYLIASLTAGLMAAGVQAQSRTWNGGGTADSNWSTADNWGGTAPVSGDALYFGGSLRLTNDNDLAEGTLFSSLVFNSGAGAFWLSGSGVNLGGNVTNFSTAIQTVGLPLTLDATRTFCASNGALVVTNSIGGAGGLIKTGAQPLSLTVSNSYAGATTVKAGGVLRITHGNALGSTSGTTTAEDGSIIEVYGGITIPESFALYGDASTSYGGAMRIKGGSNVISGVILNGSRIKTNAGSLDLIGGATGGQLVLGADSGFIRVAEKPITLGGNNFYAHTGQPVILAVTNNTWGQIEVSGGYVRTDVANALAVSGILALGGGNPSGLNMNGFDQTVGRLLCTTTNAGTRVVTSASPATLTVNQSASTTVNAGFTGAASLVKTGTGSILFTNSLSTTAGNVTLSNGTLVIEYGAGFSASTNVFVAGGTLELRHGASLWDSARVFINDGAKIKIGTNLMETVGALFINGAQQARGTYGKTGSGALFTDDAHFDGAGVLNVQSSPPVAATNVTWDAEGGVDTLLSTPTNWDGDETPVFDGTPAAIFGTGGSSATVDAAASFYGLTFNRNGNFTLAAGAGVITNGAGGIFAEAPNATARTYAIADDIVLSDNQTWAVVTNRYYGPTTLNVTGSIDDGLVPCSIAKVGFGTLNLYTNSTFDGAMIVSNGVLRIYNSSALGSTNGNTVVNGFAGCNLCLSGNLNLWEPLVLNGEKDNAGTLRIDSGSNTLSGPVSLYGQVRLVVYSGALAVEGGMVSGAGDSGGSLVVNSGTATYFRNKPLTLGTSRTFYTDSGGLTSLAVTNNTWNETQVMSGTLRLDLPNALPARPLRLGVDYGPGGTVDLNGNDQTVSKLYLGTAKPATRTITSPSPALLTVNQSENTLFDARFTGAVSLLKLGAGALTLTNAFTTTSGSFAVSNGTLLVTRDGTFGANSKAVAVGGTGTLTLSNSVAIADSAALALPAAGVTTAKVNLASNVNESVRYLYLGAKQQRSGIYGSSASPATIKDDEHFSGPGVLTVLCDDFGTLIKMQ